MKSLNYRLILKLDSNYGKFEFLQIPENQEQAENVVGRHPIPEQETPPPQATLPPPPMQPHQTPEELAFEAMQRHNQQNDTPPVVTRLR